MAGIVTDFINKFKNVNLRDKKQLEQLGDFAGAAFTPTPKQWLYMGCAHFAFSLKSAGGALINGFKTLIGASFLNINKNQTNQSGFSYLRFFNALFYNPLLVPCFDRFKENLNAAHDAKDMNKFKKVMTQSLLIIIILYGFILVPAAFALSRILVALQVPQDIITLVNSSMLMHYPLKIFDLLGDLLHVHAHAQGIESIPKWLNYLNLFVTTCMSFGLIVMLDMKIVGWILSMLYVDGVRFIRSAYVYFAATDPESRGFVGIREAFDGLFTEMFTTIRHSFHSNEIMHISYELCVAFVALRNQDFMVVAFSNMISYSGVFFHLGEAFSIESRSKMEALIGIGQVTKAKSFYKMSIVVCFITGLVLAGSIYLFRNLLVAGTSNASQDLLNLCMQLFLIYCLFMPRDMVYSTISMGLKAAGKKRLIVIFNIIFAIVLNLIFLLVIHFMKVSVVWIFIEYSAVLTLQCLASYIIAIWFKWVPPGEGGSDKEEDKPLFDHEE